MLDVVRVHADDPATMEAALPIDFRRAGRPRVHRSRFSQRWYGRLLLVAFSIALLTCAYAPISQFYLAWVGLAPWLIVIARCRSYRGAALWGWIGGLLFFVANMWWMAYVTFLGMLGLMAILAAYWALMGLIVYRVWGKPLQQGGDGPLDTPLPDVRLIWLIPVAWAALEFIRGNFIWRGLPWLYLGHTQSPFLAACQIADITGVYGISVWIVLINAILAAAVLNSWQWRSIRNAGIAAIALTIGMIGYGVYRIRQTSLQPGPTVAVVQANYPQSNGGEKGASEEDTVAFHYQTTKTALLNHTDTDLVVWSETLMPELNPEFRGSLISSTLDGVRARGQSLYEVVYLLQNLAATFQTGLIVGGKYVGHWTVNQEKERFEFSDSRNSAYFFERSGLISDLRYDKIHIVPFGEFIPFKESAPWLYRLMISLGPPDMESYQLTPGEGDALTVFPLRKSRDPLDLSTWRLVTPICFEDIDSGLVAQMFRPGPDGQKRADALINLTNDGWFKANENTQHLQAAIFRSIENRVPTARSVNTGVSGFIDSVGRPHDLLPARTTGSSTAKMMLDPRVTFYTLYGDAFAWACVAATVIAMMLGMLSRR